MFPEGHLTLTSPDHCHSRLSAIQICEEKFRNTVSTQEGKTDLSPTVNAMVPHVK